MPKLKTNSKVETSPELKESEKEIQERIGNISSVTKAVGNIKKDTKKKVIEIKELSNEKDIKEFRSSIGSVLNRLGDVIAAVAKGTKDITVKTAIASKEAIGQYGQAIKADINFNKENLLMMTLSRVSPLVGYFTTKLLGTRVFKDMFSKVKSGFGSAISSVVSKTKDLFTRKKAPEEMSLEEKASKTKEIGRTVPGNLATLSPQTKALVESNKEPIKKIKKIKKTKPATAVPLAKKLPKKPEIPHMQTGGYVERGGLANVHPAEVVAPIEDVLKRIDASAKAEHSIFSGIKKLLHVSELRLGNMEGYVTQSTQVQSKGLIRAFTDASVNVHTRYQRPTDIRQLDALEKIRYALGAEISKSKEIFQEVLFSNKFLRRSVYVFRMLNTTIGAPFRGAYGLLKSRGGYRGHLPTGKNMFGNMVKILGMIYVNTAVGIDNINNYLKSSNKVLKDLTGSLTGKTYEDIKEIQDKDKRWSIAGRTVKGMSYIASKFKKKEEPIEEGQERVKGYTTKAGKVVKSYMRKKRSTKQECIESPCGSYISAIVPNLEAIKDSEKKSLKGQKKQLKVLERVRARITKWGKSIWKWVMFGLGFVKDLLFTGIKSLASLLGPILSSALTLAFVGTWKWLKKGVGFLTKKISSLAGFFTKGGWLAGISKVLKGPLAILQALVDGFLGFRKAKEWYGKEATIGEKAASTAGAAIGGTGSGVSGAIFGALKGGSMGALAGSVVPVVGTAIGGALGAMAGGILGFIGGKKISGALLVVGKQIKKVVSAVWGIITWPYRILLESTAEFRKKVAPFFNKIAGIIKDVRAKVWDFITYPFVTLFGQVYKAVKQVLGGVFKGVWELVKGVGKGAWELVKTLLRGVETVLKSIGTIVVGVVTGKTDLIKKGVISLVKLPLDIIRGLFSTVWEIIYGAGKGVLKIAGGILKAAQTVFMLPYTIISGMFTKTKDLIVSAAKGSWKLIKNIQGSIWSFISWPFKLMANLFLSAPKKLYATFKTNVDNIWKTLQSGMNIVLHPLKWISDIPGRLGSLIGKLIPSWMYRLFGKKKNPTIKDKVVEIANDTFSLAGTTAEKAKKAVKPATTYVSKKAQEVKERIEKTKVYKKAQEVKEKVEKVEAYKEIKAATVASFAFTSHLGGVAIDKVKEISKDVKKKVSKLETYKEVKDLTSKTKKIVTDTSSIAIDKVMSISKDVKRRIVEADMINTVKEFTIKTKKVITDTSTIAIDKVMSISKEVKKRIVELEMNIKIKNLIEKTKTTVIDISTIAIDKVMSISKDVKEKISTLNMSEMSKNLISKTKTAVVDMSTIAIDKIVEISKSIKESINIKTIEKKAADAFQTTKKSIESLITFTASTITNIYNNVKTKILGERSYEEKTKGLVNSSKDFIDSIISFTSKKLSKLKKDTQSYMDQIGPEFKGKLETIKAQLGSNTSLVRPIIINKAAIVASETQQNIKEITHSFILEDNKKLSTREVKDKLAGFEYMAKKSEENTKSTMKKMDESGKVVANSMNSINSTMISSNPSSVTSIRNGGGDNKNNGYGSSYVSRVIEGDIS